MQIIVSFKKKKKNQVMLYLTFQEPSKLVDIGSDFQTWIPHLIVVTGGQNSPSVRSRDK